MTKPLVLCIMDGVGINSNKKCNAVFSAKMPFFDDLLKKYPNASLDASGTAVGLPAGTMGNSEVGHITIGSGRIVNQFLRRFQLEDWGNNKPLHRFINEMKKSGGTVHLSGLMSDGCVHSSINDIIFIAKKILAAKLKICIHFIADGRDTPPQSAQKYINQIRDELSDAIASSNAWFGTLSGRYYAMDRNKNLERTEAAFNAIANASSKYVAASIEDALKNAYARGETDEFIWPTIITPGSVPISKEDGFIFGNYRSDRARQIMRSIITTGANILCFSQYGEGLDGLFPALLPDIKITNTIGDILANAGKTQLRIAETEKYNHVTYFFDAERDINFQGEEKILIPSPSVATFDIQPEMSAPKITDALLSVLSKFDVVILNYANGDMVGHTGNFDAAVKAMECLDEQLSKLVPSVLELDGTILITADHGNAEQMWDFENDSPLTSHTTNQVPFIFISNTEHSVHDGGLSDVAPTMLKILGLIKPAEMTGKSLIA